MMNFGTSKDRKKNKSKSAHNHKAHMQLIAEDVCMHIYEGGFGHNQADNMLNQRVYHSAPTDFLF